MASEPELERFRQDHQRLHGRVTTGSFALHVDLDSDTLHLGPFEERGPALNLFEGIRIGARHVLDMGTTEVEGFSITDEHGSYWAILYDPMPGGSGFLPQIIRHWEPICERAKLALERCATGCDTACYSCLKHFRNQIDHELLNRHRAIEVLDKWSHPLVLDHAIPQVISQPSVHPAATDSDAELNFARICQSRGFPVPPEAQYRVSFGDGSYTDADWAYPAHKVLVYIDGMGPNLHGDPDRARRDKLLRAKARMKGYQIMVVTAEGLQDTGSVADHLQELALYLGVDPDAISRTPISSELDEIISRCDVELLPVLEAFRGRSLPLPELGYELSDDRGDVAGDAELAWPEQKVAVIGSWQSDNKSVFEAAGWTAFTMEEFQADQGRLWAALGTSGG